VSAYDRSGNYNTSQTLTINLLSAVSSGQGGAGSNVLAVSIPSTVNASLYLPKVNFSAIIKTDKIKEKYNQIIKYLSSPISDKMDTKIYILSGLLAIIWGFMAYYYIYDYKFIESETPRSGF